MTRTVGLGWAVPITAVETFDRFLVEKHGETRRHANFELEEAIREWLDEDRGTTLEAVADDLLEAAGFSREPLRKKTPSGEKQTLGWNISADLKQQFQKAVDEYNRNRDDRQNRLYCGEALAKAMIAYADGGRLDRIERKIQRVADDARGFLEALDDDGDNMTGRARKRTIIRKRLTDRPQFTEKEIREEIEDVAGQTVVDDYLDDILEELDYEPNPVVEANGGETAIYIPPAKAERKREQLEEQRREEREREAETKLETQDTDPDPSTVDSDSDTGTASTETIEETGGQIQTVADLESAQRQLYEELGWNFDDDRHVEHFNSHTDPDPSDPPEFSAVESVAESDATPAALTDGGRDIGGKRS